MPSPALRLFRFAQFSKTIQRARIGRRFQSSEAAPNAQHQNYAQRLWSSPVGVKTVHFWAPVMKWALVLTGISDFARPAEKLSLTQNLALTATGVIWTRWCFVIRPKNMFLAAVNFFLGCVGATQVARILFYQRGVKNGTIAQVAETDAKGIARTVEDAAADPKGTAKAAVQ